MKKAPLKQGEARPEKGQPLPEIRPGSASKGIRSRSAEMQAKPERQKMQARMAGPQTTNYKLRTKNDKPQKRTRTVLLFIFAILLGMSLAYFVYTVFFFEKPLETRVLPIDFTMTENKLIGINLTPGILSFGRVPLGGYGKRYLYLENGYDFPIKVKTYSSGNISPYVSLSNYTFMLQPGQAENVSVSISAFSGSIGHYEGYLAFAFYKG